FVLFYFTFFFLFFVDCTGLYPIVCSVQIIYTFSCVCCDVKATALFEKKNIYFSCYCIFVCCFIFELKHYTVTILYNRRKRTVNKKKKEKCKIKKDKKN